MDDNKEVEPVEDSNIDENMNLFVFGNIKIKDIETGEILVNLRF